LRILIGAVVIILQKRIFTATTWKNINRPKLKEEKNKNNAKTNKNF